MKKSPTIVSRLSLRLVSPLFGLVATALLPATAHATVYTWSPSTGNWSAGANWTSDTGATGVPTTIGTITYKNTNTTYKVTVDTDQTVAGLVNNSKILNLALSSAAGVTRTLTITGEMTIGSAGAVNFYCADANSVLASLSVGSINMGTGAGTISLGRNNGVSGNSADRLQSVSVGGVSMKAGAINLNVAGAASLGLVNFTGNGATRTITLVNDRYDALTGRAVTVSGLDDSGLTAGSSTIVGAAGSVTTTGTATAVTLTINNATDYSSGVAIQDGANGKLSVTKSGTGAQTLSGVLSYTGLTKVDGGKLTINGDATGATGGVQVNAGATLGGSGTIGISTSTVGVNGGTVNGSGLTLGAATFHGASTLSGTNKAASVTIADGTTILSGTTKSTSTLVVSSGATLNADGTIDGTARIEGLLKGNSTVRGTLSLVSGTLSSGNSAGITKVDADFTMDASSKLVAEVTGAVAGVSYDQVQVSGNVSLAGKLDLTTLSGLTLGDTITLIDNTGDGTTTGFFSTILTNGSSFALTSNADYSFAVAGTEYLLSFKGDSGNDLQFNDVTLTVVPEPQTWALISGGVGLLMLQRRRRAQNS